MAPEEVTDRLGRPLRDLRISVTDRCNFRCPYCMPRERFGEDHTFLPRRAFLTFDEIEKVVQASLSLGLEKVRLTGGEPLLRPDLADLVSRLSKLGVDLALTTNGSLLRRNAPALAAAEPHHPPRHPLRQHPAARRRPRRARRLGPLAAGQEDGTEEYLSDIPDWVARNVDEYLTELEAENE